jgi:hypothetical protein
MSASAIIIGVAGLGTGARRDGTQGTGGRQDPGDLLATLREAQAAGAGALLAPPSAPLFKALGALAPRERPELLALVPNVVEYLRDSSETGLVGAALKRLRRANPALLARLIRHVLAHPRGILTKDFRALVAILLELELAGFSRFRPSHIVLAAPWTDLALAAGNRAFFGFYTSYIQQRHRARPCLETQNGGHLLSRLREWGIAMDTVVTALNPKGFRMKPTREACLREMARTTARIVAREVTAGGTISLEEGVAFARSSGATGVLLDLARAEDILLVRTCHAAWAGDGAWA